MGYEPIQESDFQGMLEKAKEVQRIYPECVIGGGVALRLWCREKGVPAPRQYGNDIDIGLPNSTKFHQNRTSDGEWIDSFPIIFPLTPPFHSQARLGEDCFTLPTPELLLVFKAQSIRDGYEARGNVMEKDIVYFGLLQSLADPRKLLHLESEAWRLYGEEAVTKKLGGGLQACLDRATRLIAEATHLGKISPAVHPECATSPQEPSKPKGNVSKIVPGRAPTCG